MKRDEFMGVVQTIHGMLLAKGLLEGGLDSRFEVLTQRANVHTHVTFPLAGGMKLHLHSRRGLTRAWNSAHPEFVIEHNGSWEFDKFNRRVMHFARAIVRMIEEAQ